MPTKPGSGPFDAAARERELLAEANSWDTSTPVPAEPNDIPTVDIGPWRTSGEVRDLQHAADALRAASESVGFYQLVGHGIDRPLIDRTFAAIKAFHEIPEATRRTIRMDHPDWPVGGVGFLPVGERKLPRREFGNLNEAFLAKSDTTIAFDDNQWLAEADAPGFKTAVAEFAAAVESVALGLVEVYAAALDLPRDFFADAFTTPFWRLRMTHYPPDPPGPDGAFGIAPHVDTTFFTLLLQDSPGLTIFHEPRQQWVEVPVIDNAFVVNSGELLRQWSNDRFLSARHFANNTGRASRYSIPFFFNANADHVMECLPSCHDADNPPKYAPVSYRASQAAVQGE